MTSTTESPESSPNLGPRSSESSETSGRISVTDRGTVEFPTDLQAAARLRHRDKRGRFRREKGDWSSLDSGKVPDFLIPGLSLREKLRSDIENSSELKERVGGGQARGYQDLLNEASAAFIPYLSEVVSGTAWYRVELAKQLKQRKKNVPDAENLGDETFLRAIVSGEILNSYEDFRTSRSEDYLLILSLSQAVRLSAVELIKTWAESGQISDKELKRLSMTKEELAIIGEMELTVGPVFNAIFNKLLYHQSALGQKSPGKWGKKVYDDDEVLGKIFIHDYDEKRGGEKYNRRMRTRDFVFPEWLKAADVIKQFVPKMKDWLPPEIWEQNWQGIEMYFDQLDLVMRSQTLSRTKIDAEYDKLYQIARELSPKVRFLLLPPTMEDSSLAIDGMFTMLWRSDKDVRQAGRYNKIVKLFQKTIDQIELWRPGLVGMTERVASLAWVGTLLNVSGQTSESRLQGGRIWRAIAEIHEDVIDDKTEKFRWPLLVKTGLVKEGDKKTLAQLKKAVRWYMVVHEMSHGVVPDYKRGAMEELKCDLFGLDRLVTHLGGVDKIPKEFRRALVLAVISEDLFNLAASSDELGSLGSQYLIPSALRLDWMVRKHMLKIEGQNLTIEDGSELKILKRLATWGREEIMEDLYIYARKNTTEPSDKMLLQRVKIAMENNHRLRNFARKVLPQLMREVGEE